MRTYLLERRDVANKSELGRIAMAQQRTQQSVSGTTSVGSLGGLSDGNSRVQGPGGSNLPSDIQVHQGSQPGGIGSHDGGNSHGQEPERSTIAESSIHNGNDQPLQQVSGNEGGQNTLRRPGALGFVASAASAFEAAKDIMEALRGKHANLASELEVIFFQGFKFNLLCLTVMLCNLTISQPFSRLHV